jgi:dihydroorotase
MYDLLIKAGHVLDPGEGIDGPLDIAIGGGRIAALGQDIAATEARQTLQVRGDNRYVLPGLIDIHTHVAYGATTNGVGLDCCEPDEVGVYSGVTTIHHLPFMVHIGNRLADRQRGETLTRFVLDQLEPGDIITHLCTPHPGGILDDNGRPVAEFRTARDNGVIMDAALGRHNFSHKLARQQAELGIHPDTISTDITPGGYGEIVYSLLECMAKFMALGCSLNDVVQMTTTNAARAIGVADELGAIRLGRAADLSIIDVVSGQWQFTDTLAQPFTGENALVPVHTLKDGQLIAPNWGPHPWGWLPEAA